MGNNEGVLSMITEKDIKKKFIPQKVYSVLVKSTKGSLIHLGVHHTLDEAYKAAKDEMTVLFGKTPSHVDMDLWTTLEASEVVSSMLVQGKEGMLERATSPAKPAAEGRDPFETLVKAKNDLMRSILDSGDTNAIEKAKNLLSKNDIRYLMSKIGDDTIPRKKGVV